MDNVTFSTIGALIGLALSIFLIIKNFHATYALIIGALVGGIIGGGGLVGTVSAMVKGSESMISVLSVYSLTFQLSLAHQ